MIGFATTYNTKFYKLCHKSKASGLRPAKTQQFLHKVNNVLGWQVRR